jgi:basic amino acid/polyamine antiporter, APA family
VTGPDRGAGAAEPAAQTAGTGGAQPRAPAAAPAAAAGGLLPRRLGVWSAAAVLVGSTIGSGIFRVPSIAAETGSIGAVALLWLLGGAVAVTGALTLAELATMMPRSGGIYVYLREAYGPLPAFLFGWTRLLLLQPALLGGIAMVFAAYASVFFPLGDVGTRILAGSLVVLLAGANIRSVHWGAAVQNASTVAKIVALAGLAGVAFLFGDPAGGAFAQPASAPAAGVGLGAFGIALIAVLWTYDGWADVTYMAGEVRDPARTLPRALIGGSAAIVAIYLLVNAAYLYVLPLDEMAASRLVAADAAARVFGAAGASLVAALVMLSTFGALNGTVMSGPRVFFALAGDGLFFRRFAAVHPRFETPHTAIALAAVLGVGYISVRTFEQLAEAFVLGLWPFHVLAVGAVFLLRRSRPDAVRPYRTFGYPVVPLVFLSASVAMLLNALIRQPASTMLSFGIILAGVPAYYTWRAVVRAP